MKKLLLVVITLLVIVLLSGFVTVFFWTQTPYGTLDYLAAIGLRYVYTPPDIQNHSAEELREQYRQRESEATEYQEYISRIKDTTITAFGQAIPLRLYYPSEADHLPILIYYHGGGFVFGTLNEYNLLCAKLAHKTSALVVSVDYRLAPEHSYPAPGQDAYAALQWVYQHATTLGGDSTRLAVAGDSAGGNLAAVVSQMVRDSSATTSESLIDCQILLYPATQSIDLTTESHQNFGRDYGLTTEQVDWYIEQYLPHESERYEAYASPLLAEDLHHLPPALVVLAGFDPLKTEGQQYADKMKSAGVPVTV
ncbi:MAG: alpha/beta hydrolase, partial [Cyclobacteriaceae bacterium]